MNYCVYILVCNDNSYYTGYTKDLKNRFEQHLNGKGSRYTRIKKPYGIVYVEWFKTRSDAIKREKEIKRLNHDEKHDLIINSKNNFDL